jgi:hypothetical protein
MEQEENSRREIRQELLMHWQIQERLLQSYRLLFLLSQSLLFVAAAFAQAVTVFLLMLFPAIILLWFWGQIAQARAMDVSYFQMLVIRNEGGELADRILTRFKQWQKQSAREKEQILKEFGLHKSQTRLKMEKYLPLLFASLWGILSVTKTAEYVNL